MGWMMGFEPTAPRATIWCSNQLSYIHHVMVRPGGLEPPAHGLEVRCSFRLSYGRIIFFGAGNGIRTRDPQLGRLVL